MDDVTFVRLLIFFIYVNNVLGDVYYQKKIINSTTIIQSPNYPRKYPANTTWEWELMDEEKVGKWKLIFLGGLKLEGSDRCEKDYLEIEEKKEILARLCGPMSSVDPITSAGPNVKITFSSDGHAQDVGFKMQIVYVLDNDGKNKLKEMGGDLKGMKATVVHEDKEETKPVLFIVLVVVLVVAVVVFVSLSICLAVGIYNRRRQLLNNPQSSVRHVIKFKNPGNNNNSQTPKRYSRPSITERQDSFPLTHNPNAPRGILLSTGSRRYVPV